jgi:hypothetical protein
MTGKKSLAENIYKHRFDGEMEKQYDRDNKKIQEGNKCFVLKMV